MKNTFFTKWKITVYARMEKQKIFEKNKEFLLNNHMNVINKQPITA